MTSEQVKKLRFSMDLTQKDFSKKLNVSISTVQSWEQGHRKPNERAEYKLKRLK